MKPQGYEHTFSILKNKNMYNVKAEKKATNILKTGRFDNMDLDVIICDVSKAVQNHKIDDN